MNLRAKPHRQRGPPFRVNNVVTFDDTRFSDLVLFKIRLTYFWRSIGKLVQRKLVQKNLNIPQPVKPTNAIERNANSPVTVVTKAAACACYSTDFEERYVAHPTQPVRDFTGLLQGMS